MSARAQEQHCLFEDNGSAGERGQDADMEFEDQHNNGGYAGN